MKPKIMVSSTIRDLFEERRHIVDVITSLKSEPLYAEGLGSAGAVPYDVCKKWALTCDIYVCILT